MFKPNLVRCVGLTIACACLLAGGSGNAQGWRILKCDGALPIKYVLAQDNGSPLKFQNMDHFLISDRADFANFQQIAVSVFDSHYDSATYEHRYSVNNGTADILLFDVRFERSSVPSRLAAFKIARIQIGFGKAVALGQAECKAISG